MGFSFDDFIEGVERDVITMAFQQYGSSRRVARALKISQTKASRLIRKYCSQA
ncbi:hypothetical protein [Thermacetogenium phaeum]|uniref:hypothetical protein n=1 Tax=Thermacetogenium phaeum TaxID=85874 RepID=UPI0022A8E5E6|nr:hypothetical protein [Thermacetogenium phaeum]